MIPPQLYIPRENDIRSGVLLARYAQRQVEVTAAVLLDHGYRTPDPNTVLWVDNIHFRAIGGGAQTVANVTIDVPVDTAGGPNGIELWTADLAAAAPANISGSGEAGAWSGGPPRGFLVMPGDFLRISVNFSAGVAGNTLVTAVYGMSFPRGNLTRALDTIL